MGTFAVIGIIAAVATATNDNQPRGDEAVAKVTSPTYIDSRDEKWQMSLARARAAETDGNLAEAVRHYRVAAVSGSGGAAKRLGEIYLRGAPGVDRDMAEAFRWNRQAEVRGEVLAQAIRLR